MSEIMLVESDEDLNDDVQDVEDLMFQCHEFITNVLMRKQPKAVVEAGQTLLLALKPYVQDETLH